MTISESTNLAKDEVERMVQGAQEHAADDKRRRETVDARNQADSLAYQAERLLKDFDGKVPIHEKARVEQLIEETRAAVKDDNTSRERYQQLASDLQQAVQMISGYAYQQSGATGESGSGFHGGPRPKGDDVIDAEFTEN